MRLRLLATTTAIAALAALGGTAAAGAPAPDPVDCTGPAGDAEPGTPEWQARELREAWCGEQRATDAAANPLYATGGVAATAPATAAAGTPQLQDPFRDPATHDGTRFRWQPTTFTEESGQQLAAHLFLPCDDSCTDLPDGLQRNAGPYPAVVVVHGGSARQESYWWGVQPLAEAGYMVLTFQVPTRENTGSSSHPDDTRAALDYLLATPQAPNAAGEHNPFWRELDRSSIGLAGHSAGGVAANLVGQQDPRVRAIVSWDRAQSTQMPDDLRLRTPSLFITADYNCQQVPVCLPEPYDTAPDPLGPGNKDRDFQRLRAAGVDTMKASLRSSTHLDFTEMNVGQGSRHGAVVTSYLTLAWFDRYLKGTRPGGKRLAKNALDRLTADVFDGSADVHSISGGRFDPVAQANVPATLEGQRVVDRLSFRFRSGYWLDGGKRACEDIRLGCR